MNRTSPELAFHDALEAAGLSTASSRERRGRLTEPERELHRWILRRFGREGRPPVSAIRRDAARLGIDPDAALHSLAAADLVHLDPEGGEIAVAYPFSGLPTAHKVHLGTGTVVDAMCAVDALGTPFMLDTSAEIRTRDHLTGEEIQLRVNPAAEVASDPPGVVVFVGTTEGQETVAARCCPIVNFFGSSEHADQYIAQHPEVSGRVLRLAEATELGRSIFGELLVDPG